MRTRPQHSAHRFPRLATAGVLAGGALTGAVGLGTNAAVAATAPSTPPLQLTLGAGQDVVGRAVTLHASLVAEAGITQLAFTEQLPSGLAYLPGSSRVTQAGTTVQVTDPIVVALPAAGGGTLLAWTGLPVVAAGVPLRLSFAVAPAAGAKLHWAGFGAGRAWSSIATAYAGVGAAAPALTPAGAVVAGTVGDTATARLTSEVQPVGVVATAARRGSGLLAPVTGTVRVAAPRASAASAVAIRLYLPAGVAPAVTLLPGTAPKVSHLMLPVGPDGLPTAAATAPATPPVAPAVAKLHATAPVATPPAAPASPATTAAPTSTTSAPSTTTAPSMTSTSSTSTTTSTTAHQQLASVPLAAAVAGPTAAAAPTPSEAFTVLTWDVEHVPAAAPVEQAFELVAPKAGAALVTVTATTTASETGAPSTLDVRRSVAWAAPERPAALPAGLVSPAAARSGVRAGSRPETNPVQASPAAPSSSTGTDPFGTAGDGSATATAAATSAAPPAGKNANPFGATSPSTTTAPSTTSGATTPGKTSPTAATTTSSTSALAFTGLNASGELGAAGAALAAGLALVGSARHRRRYEPAHLRHRSRSGRHYAA